MPQPLDPSNKEDGEPVSGQGTLAPSAAPCQSCAGHTPVSRRPGKRRGLKHFFRFQLVRLTRLPDNAHEIALGVAWGVWVSFTPFIGFHLILCTLACVIFGGSKVASWIGSLVGNPATFPIFYYADHKVGKWMLGMEDAKFSFERLPTFPSGDVTMASLQGYFNLLLKDFEPVLLPILAGCLVVGTLAAAAFYYATYEFIQLNRQRRARKIEAVRRHWVASEQQRRDRAVED